MFAYTAQEKRLCLDCGKDILHRRSIAKRCEQCSKEHNKQLSRNHYWENREQKLQYMARRRQTPSFKRVNQEWIEKNPHKVQASRERAKQAHREKTAYNPEGRSCEKCGADISDRAHRAKRCESCSEPPTRMCIVCQSDFRARGVQIQFCSEQCKQKDQLSKELNGYTRICTKCNEQKEHTEFGLHYNLRRSVCKLCEVESQLERYYNFTPVQRDKRNSVRRDNERSKKANLSPDQKAVLRTKVRRANRRSKYGFDIDENKLYSEQEGKCAICRTPKSVEELQLDHDHETDKLRGFLCKNCNLRMLPRYEKFPPEYQDSPYLNTYLARGK